MNERFTLRRDWGKAVASDRKVVNFIMLNPSTADDVFDDATIRRCVGFAKRWGFTELVVTNLFAYRATDPKELKRLAKSDYSLAVGDNNDAHILREADNANTIVCAWGDNADGFRRDLDVIQMLRKHDLYCIRRTAKGNPAHPVREPYAVALDSPILFYPKLNIVPERRP